MTHYHTDTKSDKIQIDNDVKVDLNKGVRMPKGRKVHATGSHTKIFECHCGYEASNKTGLRLHMKATHNTELDDNIDHTIAEVCTFCKEIFDNKFQLVTHARLTGHTRQ